MADQAERERIAKAEKDAAKAAAGGGGGAQRDGSLLARTPIPGRAPLSVGGPSVGPSSSGGLSPSGRGNTVSSPPKGVPIGVANPQGTPLYGRRAGSEIKGRSTPSPVKLDNRQEAGSAVKLSAVERSPEASRATRGEGGGGGGGGRGGAVEGGEVARLRLELLKEQKHLQR
jgi:hypothetical protein